MVNIIDLLDWKTKLKGSNVCISVIQEYINHKAENIWAPLEPVQQDHRSNLAVYLITGKASGLLCREQGYRSNSIQGKFVGQLTLLTISYNAIRRVKNVSI